MQKASTSTLKSLQREFTWTGSCRRPALVAVAASRSAPRQFSTHAACRAAALLYVKLDSNSIYHQHRTHRSYSAVPPTPTPASSQEGPPPSPPPNQNEAQTPQQTTVFPDPNRSDLFYHLTRPPTPLSRTLYAFALSFLDVLPPGGVDSPAVIGWLPAQMEAEVQGGRPKAEGESGSTLDDFVGNEKFLVFLHETIKSALEQGQDPIWTHAATAHGSGWMHIGDQRNIPALGRVGDPDDILATVLVQDGQIVPGTYQPMPSYRICTVDGVLQLTPGLARHLKEALVELLQHAQEEGPGDKKERANGNY